MFRKSLLKFIRSVEGKTYHINNSVAVKLLARLRLSFSHLREHKFSSNFKDMLNPFFFNSIEAETMTHFFLRCHFYMENRTKSK